MKSRICKLLALMITVCFLMTGCEKLDYRKAVQYYNAQRYDEAIALFHELGNYENSAELFTASHYWAAMDRMEAGNYSEALPRFLKLGDYRDSADRVIECKYQMGIQAIAEARYTDAENLFRELGGYRKTADFLRQLEWQKLYDYICANGTEAGGSFAISYPRPDRTVTFLADQAAPTQIRMISNWEKDMGYVFEDNLTLVLERESAVAAFEATSEFTMNFDEGTIGSRQTGSGRIDLRTYVPGMVLTYDGFSMTVTDNHGQTTATDDSVNSTMDEAMADHLTAIMDCFSDLEVAAETNYFL